MSQYYEPLMTLQWYKKISSALGYQLLEVSWELPKAEARLLTVWKYQKIGVTHCLTI